MAVADKGLRPPFAARLRARTREALAGYGFISPWLLGFMIFVLGPMISSAFLSFTNYDVLNPPEWVGVENYSTLLLRDPLFWKSLYNTIYITVLGVPIEILLGLSIALLLNMNVKGLAFYRLVYYLPSIMPIVASSILWIWILNPHFGLLNALLALVGIKGPMWIGSEVWSKPSIILMQAWRSGANMIIYLAGLKGIPEQLYEAASIDGATPWRRFLHITIPMLTPTLLFTTIMGIINSFQIFAQAYVMTAGGPADSTLFAVYYLFNNAFAYFKMGYASALAWILFFIILVVTLLQLKLAPMWVHYEAEVKR
ncbi:MAG TPA: sugar ABC transporter permease [Firmicutes bacterium]|nr:sugar ABC transporter permease [Bacillota bacterium]